MSEPTPGGPDKCVCPDCDYEVDKERGTPCRSMECPECGVALIAGTETEEAERSMMDVRQIAASAIETALAVVKGTGEITVERAERLLYALEADLAAANGVPVAKVAKFVTEFVLVPNGDWTATDLLEALTKKVSGRTHVKGDFLVVEDPKKVTTWHLPVKINGNPDHQLMGAAKAALTVGYRGNKYEGPGKAAAIKNLKALYKAEDMEWAVGEAALGEVGSGLESFTSQVRSAFQAAFRKEETNNTDTAAVPAPSYLWVKDIFFEHPDLGNAVVVDKEGALLMVSYAQDEEGHFTFAPLEDWEQVKQTYVKIGTSETETTELGETDLFETDLFEGVMGYVSGIAEMGTVASGGSDPLILEIVPIRPGWGNERDNHYYHAATLERDFAAAFDGVKMFETNHQPSEITNRHWVSTYIETTGYGDDGPQGIVGVHDPLFAQRIINLRKLEEQTGKPMLNLLECSIRGKGNTRPGFELDGRSGKSVESLTRHKQNGIDWVAYAGAGGHTTGIQESGGDKMGNKTGGTEANETDGGKPEPDKTKETWLSESDVASVLTGAKLPEAAKERLGAARYETKETLKEAVQSEADYLTKITEAGKPKQPRGKRGSEVQPASLAERETAQTAINAKWLGTRAGKREEHDA